MSKSLEVSTACRCLGFLLGVPMVDRIPFVVNKKPEALLTIRHIDARIDRVLIRVQTVLLGRYGFFQRVCISLDL